MTFNTMEILLINKPKVGRMKTKNNTRFAT